MAVTVAVASHSLGSGFSGTMYAEVRKQVRPGQAIHECAIVMRDDPAFVRTRLLKLLEAEPRPIALIGICLRPDPETVAAFREAGVPVVLVDEAAEGASTVATDNRAGGRIAAEHLLGAGRQALAVVAGKLDVNGGYNAVQRVKGVQEVLERRGLRFAREESVEVVDYSRREGEAALAALLRPGRAVDAVFCADGDICATGILASARERRLRVPDQLAVLGFDDNPLASLSNPPLSTIRQPLGEISAAAWRLATERTQEILARPERALLEPELVQRKTS